MSGWWPARTAARGSREDGRSVLRGRLLPIVVALAVVTAVEVVTGPSRLSLSWLGLAPLLASWALDQSATAGIAVLALLGGSFVVLGHGPPTPVAAFRLSGLTAVLVFAVVNARRRERGESEPRRAGGAAGSGPAARWESAIEPRTAHPALPGDDALAAAARQLVVMLARAEEQALTLHRRLGAQGRVSDETADLARRCFSHIEYTLVDGADQLADTLDGGAEGPRDLR